MSYKLIDYWIPPNKEATVNWLYEYHTDKGTIITRGYLRRMEAGQLYAIYHRIRKGERSYAKV